MSKTKSELENLLVYFRSGNPRTIRIKRFGLISFTENKLVLERFKGTPVLAKSKRGASLLRISGERVIALEVSIRAVLA